MKLLLYIIFLLFIPIKTFPIKFISQTHDSIPFARQDSLPNIYLHEVKVVAQEIHLAGASSRIRQEAIQHTQSYSLSDLMQLLPGGITQDISFLKPKQFTLRTLGASGNALNALGTGINIDGMRISTNADLRESIDFISYGHTGPDTREIATDQIESVEVIRGIPSARYGDITTGMVLINTQKKLCPYFFSIRLTPEIKSFNIGKGWQTDSKGIFNLNSNYSHSNTVNSNKAGVYNRISLTTTYTRTQKSFALETGLSGTIVINNNPGNLKLLPEEYIKSNNQALQFRLSGTWNINRQLLTGIRWNTNISWSYASKRENRFNSGVYTTGTDATESKEQEGFFIPAQYWLLTSLESQPLHLSSGISARLHRAREKWNSNTLVGIEWNSDGNRGRGKTYTYHTPELPSQKRYDFRDIPFLHNYAFYIEENLIFRPLIFEGGVRISGIILPDRRFKPVIEPRMNLSFIALQHPLATLKSLRLRAGFGILYKMPTLAYLYNEPNYINIQSYRYRDEKSGHGLVVMTTSKMELMGAQNLALPRNVKSEAGFSGIIGSIAFDITGFHERLNDGFYSGNMAKAVNYRIYTPTLQDGVQPDYQNGEVVINRIPVGHTADTAFYNFQAVGNNIREQKSGIEFVFRTNYITPLATTFVLDGSWLSIQRRNNGLQSSPISQSSGNRSYPMCPFYDKSNVTEILQRLNTTLRAVTEIKAWGLTATIALQTVWKEKTYKKLRDNHTFFMKDNNGNWIKDGLDQDENTPKFEIPTWYMDTQGNMHRFTPALYDQPEYAVMIRQIYSRQFLKNSFSPYFMLNLHVTKDMGNHVRLIFFANNLTKTNALRYNRSTGLYMQKNPDTFFGVEFQIKI